MRTRTVKSGRYLYTPDAPKRFIRCQYCGFICDTTRDINKASPTILSDSVYTLTLENGNETLTTERSQMHEYFYLEPTLYWLKDYHFIFLSENNNDILTAEINKCLYTEVPSPTVLEVPSGCPFCGAQYTR